MKVENILLATDFSKQAQEAEVYACLWAESWGAELKVITVLEFDPGLNPEYSVNQLYLNELTKQATEALNTVRVRIAERGIPVQTRMARGIPSKEIVAAAEAENADFIVVGTAGKSGLEHVLLGSTAERVIRSAPCPVLAVPVKRSEGEQSERRSARPAIKKLLIPFDFSDCSLDALEYGVVMAGPVQAAVMLLHVLEPVSYGLDFTLVHSDAKQRREAIEKRLADIASAVNTAGVPCEYSVRGGLPNDSILEAAKTLSADMVVMGTHGRRGLSHALYGSVAEAVLRKSRCPVLMVRSPKFRPGHRRALSVLSAGEGSEN
ncbi:MAG: universal stress protein [Nitrospira sp.]|nr:universal stress protein [Nitrospira sp.]